VTLDPQYQNGAGGQPLPGGLARTWRRNANYRHGWWCRYRRRTEHRLHRAQRRVIAYVSQRPWYLPAAPDYPDLPAGYLPRRLWTAAVAYIHRARACVSEAIQAVHAATPQRPQLIPDYPAVLAVMIAAIGKSPANSALCV